MECSGKCRKGAVDPECPRHGRKRLTELREEGTKRPFPGPELATKPVVRKR